MASKPYRPLYRIEGEPETNQIIQFLRILAGAIGRGDRNKKSRTEIFGCVKLAFRGPSRRSRESSGTMYMKREASYEAHRMVRSIRIEMLVGTQKSGHDLV